MRFHAFSAAVSALTPYPPTRMVRAAWGPGSAENGNLAAFPS